MEGIFIASSISSRLYPGPWICWKMSKRESPLLLISRPRTSLWLGGRFAAFFVSASLVSSIADCGGTMVQVSSLVLVACTLVSSFSMGMFECRSSGGSVVSGAVLVTVTEIAGVSRVFDEREGTVTCTVVVVVRRILPSLAFVSMLKSCQVVGFQIINFSPIFVVVV